MNVTSHLEITESQDGRFSRVTGIEGHLRYEFEADDPLLPVFLTEGDMLDEALGEVLEYADGVVADSIKISLRIQMENNRLVVLADVDDSDLLCMELAEEAA